MARAYPYPAVIDMKRSPSLRSAFLVVAATLWPILTSAAQATIALPSPLGLADVIRVASERRDEIQAARARMRAGEARPIIVSALEDPMISPSLDHLPFMLGGADVSVTIEQRIPLSGIRGHRRDVRAGGSRAASRGREPDDAGRGSPGRQCLPDAAGASPHGGAGHRADRLCPRRRGRSQRAVRERNRSAIGRLRAEVEVARLGSVRDGACRASVRGAEAMLNTSLALDVDLPVPALAPLDVSRSRFLRGPPSRPR